MGIAFSIAILICDFVLLVMLARGGLGWFSSRGGDLGPFVFVLDFLEKVTNPLLYPIRHVLPEKKRDTNLPVAIAIGILLVILVPVWIHLLIVRLV